MALNPKPTDRASHEEGDDSSTAIAIPAKQQNPRGRRMRVWGIWSLVNLLIAAYFLYGLFAPASTIKASWLPGETTHGHYQIELDCNACHSPSSDPSNHSSENLMQGACIKCHGQQLKLANDTHPAKKFNDPTNADRLLVLNAQDCLTCHREHVPDQTLAMGLTLPSDYCWHCHQEIEETRPSHKGMAFDSCATAGCHNYHDNRALFEKYLNDHADQPDHLNVAVLATRNFSQRWQVSNRSRKPLAKENADAKSENAGDQTILDDWASTAHAATGVNCSDCHQVAVAGDEGGKQEETPVPWSDSVGMEACERCHQRQTESFVTGKHGMRLAAGMSAMTPAQARLSMHSGAAHRELTCNACHPGHRFDTQFAATEACQTCHADSHTLAYDSSPHAELWRNEIAGDTAVGSGVSCATCHLPRSTDGDEVWVNHDQSSNLRPNETMARQVCGSCHGLEFSLSSLADPNQILTCFGEPPSKRVKSVQMARDWFVVQEKKRQKRKTRNRRKDAAP